MEPIPSQPSLLREYNYGFITIVYISNLWSPCMSFPSLPSGLFRGPGGDVVMMIAGLYWCSLLLWSLAPWTTAGARTTIYKATGPPLDLWALGSFFHYIQQESSFNSLWSALLQNFLSRILQMLWRKEKRRGSGRTLWCTTTPYA